MTYPRAAKGITDASELDVLIPLERPHRQRQEQKSMNAVGAVRRLLARQTSYRRVSSAHSNRSGNGNGNGSGTGRRRRLSDPPAHESEEEEEDEDEGDPYVDDGDVAHGPFVYASFVMLGLAMLLRISFILSSRQC